MPKEIQCSNCGDLGHNKRSSECEKYFEEILLKPTRELEDGTQLTKAVNKIRKFIDECPGVIKEDIIVDEDHEHNPLPLHWVCAQKCPLQVVQLIYEKYPGAIKVKRDSFLPLHMACLEEPYAEDVIRFLISKNPDARTQCDVNGRIPLHYLCDARSSYHFEISEETLDQMLYDCPETLWSKRSEDGRNALRCSTCVRASSSANLTSMLRKQILHYAREFKSTNSHQNFYHLFKSNCFDLPTLKLYCEEWPEFAYFDLKRGARPLHIACSANLSHRIGLGIRYLITRAPGALALQDSSGRTPLHSVLRNGHGDSDLVDSLIRCIILKANPKVLSIRDNRGFTPMHVACSEAHSYRNSSCAKVALLTGAPDALALQDSSGCTPLHLLLRNKNLGRGGSALTKDALVSCMLNANPKVLMVRDKKGLTPLVVASKLDWSLNVIYSMFRFDPQWHLSSSWFPDSKMCEPIQRKRKR
jgi:ankyrin repeat protein